jgi:hypothetical protein
VQALHFRLAHEVIRHELPVLSVQIGNRHTKGLVLFEIEGMKVASDQGR